MTDDSALLRQFAADGSEPAFRALVDHYLPLVNATARRLVNGDAHLAQDVTQTVFTDLARKARALSAETLLGGWLYRHTCFTAAKAIRTERRRRQREHTAFEMNSLHIDPGPDQSWSQIAPVLDDALGRLPAADRDALVLRYFEHRDLRSIGQALGTGEDAAQKRIARALEKLRAIFHHHGLTFSAAVLGASLDVHAATPVSATLAASISSSALTGAASSTGLTLTTMITSKLAIGVAASLAVAGITSYIVFTPSAASDTAQAPAAPVAHAMIPPVPAAQPLVIPTPAPAVATASATPSAPQVYVDNQEGPSTAVAPSSQTVGYSVGGGTATWDATTGYAIQSMRINPDQTGTFTINHNGVITTQTIPLTMPQQGGDTFYVDADGVIHQQAMPTTNGIVTVSTRGGDGRRVMVSSSSPGAPTGTFTTNSGGVSIKDGIATVTKTENGVTTTQTVPVPAGGTTISDGNSGYTTSGGNGGVGFGSGTGGMNTAPGN